MTVAITGFGFVVLVFGACGLVRPKVLIGLVERAFSSRQGLFLTFAFRAVFGILLVTAASETRFPLAIGVLGVLALLSAASIPFLGYQRIRRLVGWWTTQPGHVVRVTSLFVCAFGVFLIYA